MVIFHSYVSLPEGKVSRRMEEWRESTLRYKENVTLKYVKEIQRAYGKSENSVSTTTPTIRHCMPRAAKW